MELRPLEFILLTPSPCSSSSIQQNSQLSCLNLLPSIDSQNQASTPTTNPNGDQEHHQELLDLSLSLRPSSNPNPNVDPNPADSDLAIVPTGPIYNQPRGRTNPFHKLKRGKNRIITAPYLWATDRRATVHNLNYLLSHNIRTISGDVECRGCQQKRTVEYKLVEKFEEIRNFVLANKWTMNDRAPDCWMNPRLDNCESCGNSLKPVSVKKKRDVNWLFLLLGQMLGCCKLSELKYFCKHTKNHRTGAKNRVLYLAYIGLCKQLDPHGHF